MQRKPIAGAYGNLVINGGFIGSGSAPPWYQVSLNEIWTFVGGAINIPALTNPDLSRFMCQDIPLVAGQVYDVEFYKEVSSFDNITNSVLWAIGPGVMQAMLSDNNDADTVGEVISGQFTANSYFDRIALQITRVIP